jgi:hypothetical protein
VREGSFVVALREGRLRRDVFNRQPRNVVRIYNGCLRTAKVALARQENNVWRSNLIAPVTLAVGFCLYDIQGSARVTRCVSGHRQRVQMWLESSTWRRALIAPS